MNWSELLDHVREVGGYFRAQLEALKAKHDCIREVRGMGLMLAMELDSCRHSEGGGFHPADRKEF